MSGKDSFTPEWFEGELPERSYRSAFKWGAPDGFKHPNPRLYALMKEIFGLDDRQFRAIRTRFVPDAEPDPWDVLGVDPSTPMSEVRAAWRTAVRESHPDRMMARGLPEEAIRMAEKRLIAVNQAWETISQNAA